MDPLSSWVHELPEETKIPANLWWAYRVSETSIFVAIKSPPNPPKKKKNNPWKGKHLEDLRREKSEDWKERFVKTDENHDNESVKVNFHKGGSFEHPRTTDKEGSGRGSREGRRLNQKLCLGGHRGSKKGEWQIQQGTSRRRRDKKSERTEHGDNCAKESVMKRYNKNRLRAI